MIHHQALKCRYCGSTDLVKNGNRVLKDGNKTQRFGCNSCKKSFVLDYTYTAWKPEVKDKILEMTLNSSGVRDTARVLGVSKGTVLSELKKKHPVIKTLIY
jgi:transposase-like protein